MSEKEPVFATAPPETIEFDDGYRLVRVSPSLAAAGVDAINQSLDHLAPWMPWASEPATIEGLTELFTSGHQRWDDRHEFVYSMLAPADVGGGTGDVRVVGGFGLHNRIGPDGLEIGYWVHVDHVGRGLATRAAAALTDAAVAIDGVDRVRIKCRVDNVVSARIPAKLGYDHLGSWTPRPDDTGEGEMQFWETTADAWRRRRGLRPVPAATQDDGGDQRSGSRSGP